MSVKYFYQARKIDFDAERQRIDRKGVYNRRQRKWLHGLVDLVEQGKLPQASAYVRRKDHPDDWKEYLAEEIYQLLWDMAVVSRPILREQLEREWKKRDKQGLPT